MFNEIDLKISMGDILTSVSILVSLFSLMSSFSKDRDLRRKEQADIVRNAAGRTIAKLDRWKEITLSLFEEIQPLFVETTEILSKDYDILVARDFLWKRLNEERIEILKKILGENIETAYVDLYGYHPHVRDLFEETLNQLKADTETLFEKLLNETQDDILFFSDKKDAYQNADLGNRLRYSAGIIREEYHKVLKDRLRPLDEFLNDLVSKSDKDLLEGKESKK